MSEIHTPSPNTSESIWYEDLARKEVHRNVVRAGRQRLRQLGKRIGRPRLSERPMIEQEFAKVMEQLSESDGS